MSDPAPSSSPATQWSLPARYLVAVLLLLLAAMAVLLLLPLLQVLLLAFLISFLMFIPARALKRRTRLPYSLIIVVFFLAMFGLQACALLTLIPNLRINVFNSMWTVPRGLASSCTSAGRRRARCASGTSRSASRLRPRPAV